MSREYQIDGVYVNETDTRQYQVETVYLAETVETSPTNPVPVFMHHYAMMRA